MDKETLEFLQALKSEILSEVKQVSNKVDNLDSRLGNVENKLGDVENRLSNVESRLDNLEKSFKVHEDETMKRFKEVLNVMNERYEDLKEDIKTISAVQGEFRHDLERLKRKVG